MYAPPGQALTDRNALWQLIHAHALGTWVCSTPEGLVANHIPFFLDITRGLSGTLIGHVSRANDVWLAMSPESPSVVTFLGPQTYITPGWYPGKTEHGKVVPTWNYVAAHAHGVARAVDDRDWLLGMLNRLTDAHEGQQMAPWRVTDAPAGFIDTMLRGIVGIEIPIDHLEGRLKVSQDEALQDRLGTVAGLRGQAGDEATAMAELVRCAIERGAR